MQACRGKATRLVEQRHSAMPNKISAMLPMHLDRTYPHPIQIVRQTKCAHPGSMFRHPLSLKPTSPFWSVSLIPGFGLCGPREQKKREKNNGTKCFLCQEHGGVSISDEGALGQFWPQKSTLLKGSLVGWGFYFRMACLTSNFGRSVCWKQDVWLLSYLRNASIVVRRTCSVQKAVEIPRWGGSAGFSG